MERLMEAWRWASGLQRRAPTPVAASIGRQRWLLASREESVRGELGGQGTDPRRRGQEIYRDGGIESELGERGGRWLASNPSMASAKVEGEWGDR
jgi:hypothetical protein